MVIVNIVYPNIHLFCHWIPVRITVEFNQSEDTRKIIMQSCSMIRICCSISITTLSLPNPKSFLLAQFWLTWWVKLAYFRVVSELQALRKFRSNIGLSLLSVENKAALVLELMQSIFGSLGEIMNNRSVIS